MTYRIIEFPRLHQSSIFHLPTPFAACSISLKRVSEAFGSKVSLLIEERVKRGLSNLNLIGFLILVNDYLIDRECDYRKKALAEKIQKLVELLEI